MEFVKYPTIENHYNSKFDIDDTWYVVEKVHGANFSIWISNNEIKFAKRSGFITDNFYNYQNIAEKLKTCIRKLNIDNVAVFGELCGGYYPHSDVTVNPNAKRIQREVHYSPNTEFIAFDIYYDKKFLPFQEKQKLLQNAEFTTLNPLFSGTLEECLNFDIKFDSTIPLLLNLPSISPNTAEGVVIIPENFHRTKRGSRVIIKKKNIGFMEAPVNKIKKDFTEINNVIQDILTYVNQNRINNMISKEGIEISKNKLYGLVCKDVFQDYYKDNPDVREIINPHRKLVTRNIITEIQKYPIDY